MKLAAWILFGIGCLGFAPRSGHAQFKEASCREFKLLGEIARPANADPAEPVLLTVFYQMDYMKSPAILLVNEPLHHDRFEITLSSLKVFPPPPLPKEWKPKPGAETTPTLPAPASQVLRLEAESQAGETQESAPSVDAFRFQAPVMFLYPREIRFFYYARSTSRKWAADNQELKFFHDREQVGEAWQCKSEIPLPVIQLK